MKSKIKINIPKITSARKASSISKIRVKYNPRCSLSDYTGAKMKSHIKEILTSFNNYNKKTKSTEAKLIKAEGSCIAKKNVILSLREDLAYHKKINKNYNIYKKYANDICNYYKQNFQEIFEYKANLRNDLKDFIKVIDGYEDTIVQCKEDKKMMIKTSEDIIKFKKSEKVKMTERLRKINSDLEKQDKKLNNITEILNEYKEQNETYLEKLSNSELAHMIKYEILEDKYKKIVAQYEFYVDKEMKRRKIELDYKDKNLCKEEEDLADLKLKDNILKNEYLKEIAAEIKKQINEIESLNQKSLEEEELLKFLGKVFFNKVKQRRAEMELTIENQNNTNANTNKSRINKKLNTVQGSNNINFNNIMINVGNVGNPGNEKDNYANTTKDTKMKVNCTTTASG